MTARLSLLKASAAIAVATGIFGASAALADRDPAYAAARAAGEVGERMDGYLGAVGTPRPEIKKMVADINIQRKKVFFEAAQELKKTPENYAFAAGCVAIMRTERGEKYQAPDGSWATRTGAPPQLHPSCPKSLDADGAN
ncbi:YdbL family protein [Novosphingobium sp. TH158]|uniref:YdbL family protein n=1 Tax=Novosphingobium sp. TH158 TaxID=2067455 RepID=UPI000C7C3EB8|nr:YdbL family protein [Novosphingobium sp. TH158]PLK24280.1 DUF1318 domain-containing protein [Novosphingobium sp. TH158]